MQLVNIMMVDVMAFDKMTCYCFSYCPCCLFAAIGVR